ncbi:hypothetical protein ACHAWF_011984 [Thalassiosira exigua]
MIIPLLLTALSVLALAGGQDLNISLPNGLCTDEAEHIARIGTSDHNVLMRLAVCLHRNNHPSSIELYRHVRKTTPDFAYVLVNLGILSLKEGDIDSARRNFEQYLHEVGGVYGDNPAPTDKVARERGPLCRPDAPGVVDCVNALNNMGALELTDGKNASAATFFLSRAIEIGDESMLSNAFANLGGHLAKIGDHEGAADAFISGFWVNLNQGLLGAAAGLLVRRAFLVPIVASSLEETEKTRVGIRQRVDEIIKLALEGGSKWQDDGSDLFRVGNGLSDLVDIRRIPMLAGHLHDWTNSVQLPSFVSKVEDLRMNRNHRLLSFFRPFGALQYYHYYGMNDLRLQMRIADMFSLLCPDSLFEVAGHLLGPIDSKPLRKKRVGFVSSLIGGDEPHGLLVLDILKTLGFLFDFYVVSIGSKPLSDEFLHHASGAFSVGYNEVEARNVLNSLKLDCLVYAESMNDPVVHFLGYQRFAEVQILVMGSPVTSGIPTFDYFVSGDLLEHPFRTQLPEDHYSEQVVLFDGQAISFPMNQYHPPQSSEMAAGDAASLSNATALERMDVLRAQGKRIYLCFQSIQKLQPSFDHVLVDILNGDTNGHVALQASRSSIQTSSLQRRLQEVLRERLCPFVPINCPAASKAYARIHFLPRVKSDEVLDLMRKSSVVLHPFPFGGSKTASDAVNAEVPLVTLPQRYLRGRMASAFFTAMDLGSVEPDAASCCVASSVSDYVTKALRLASDQDYRSGVVRSIRERKNRIFDERMVSVEWAKLLTRSLGIRISEEEIRSKIGFIPEERHQEDYISKAMEREQMRWKRSVLLSNTMHAH